MWLTDKSDKFFHSIKLKQRGLSLIETSMVLALAAVVVAGVMFYYQSASENDKKERLFEAMVSVNGYLASVYQNADKDDDFDGIGDVVELSRAMPEEFKTHTKNSRGEYIFNTPFAGSTWTIRVGDPETDLVGYKYELSGFDKDTCVFLASTNFGSEFVIIWINGEPVPVLPASPSEAADMCNRDKNDVTVYIKE